MIRKMNLVKIPALELDCHKKVQTKFFVFKAICVSFLLYYYYAYFVFLCCNYNKHEGTTENYFQSMCSMPVLYSMLTLVFVMCNAVELAEALQSSPFISERYISITVPWSKRGPIQSAWAWFGPAPVTPALWTGKLVVPHRSPLGCPPLDDDDTMRSRGQAGKVRKAADEDGQPQREMGMSNHAQTSAPEHDAESKYDGTLLRQADSPESVDSNHALSFDWRDIVADIYRELKHGGPAVIRTSPDGDADRRGDHMELDEAINRENSAYDVRDTAVDDIMLRDSNEASFHHDILKRTSWDAPNSQFLQASLQQRNVGGKKTKGHRHGGTEREFLPPLNLPKLWSCGGRLAEGTDGFFLRNACDIAGDARSAKARSHTFSSDQSRFVGSTSSAMGAATQSQMGAVALVLRGGCSFAEKARYLQSLRTLDGWPVTAIIIVNRYDPAAYDEFLEDGASDGNSDRSSEYIRKKTRGERRVRTQAQLEELEHRLPDIHVDETSYRIRVPVTVVSLQSGPRLMRLVNGTADEGWLPRAPGAARRPPARWEPRTVMVEIGVLI